MDDETARQAEIARIRALRGRAAPAAAKTIEEVAQERITPQHMVLVFAGAQTTGDANDQTRIFDELPKVLRDLIREAPVYISPVQVASMLLDVRNPDLIAHMIQKRIPARARELVAKNYGAQHPQINAETFDLRAERSTKSARANRYQAWLIKRQR